MRKKISLIFISFILLIAFSSCKSEEIDDLTKLASKLEEKYHGQNYFNDGYYKGSSIRTSYDVNTKITTIESRKFNAYLCFRYENFLSPEMGSFNYLDLITTKTILADNKELERENISTIINYGIVCNFHKKIVNGEIVENYSEGGRGINNRRFTLSFRNDYNRINFLKNFNEKFETRYKYLYKNVEYKNNILSVVWYTASNLNNGSQRIITTNVYFDDDFNITKVQYTDTANNFENSNNHMYSIYQIEPVDYLEEVSVPNVFDKSLENLDYYDVIL